MNPNIWIGMVNNAALLLSLFVINEISGLIATNKEGMRASINGLLVAGIGLVIMSNPYPLYAGIFFDTRSILLSVTALIFGLIPVAIASFITAFYRVLMGGPGVFAGVMSILTSAGIGLLWRKRVFKRNEKRRLICLYLMGLVVHGVMLLDMWLLPMAQRFTVIGVIAMPVMLIYPVVTVLLAELLLHQEEIRSKEEKYRRLTENIMDVVWVTDMQFQTIYVSPSVEKLLGETPEAHCVRTMEEKLTSESLKELQDLFQEEMQREEEGGFSPQRSRMIEVEHFKADGTKIWLSMHISFLRDKAGQVTGFQGVSRDISMRKKVEEERNQEKDRAQAYLDIAQMIVLAVDLDLRVTSINQAGADLIGLPKEEIVGKNWQEQFVSASYHATLSRYIQTMKKDGPLDHQVMENKVLTRYQGERMISWRNTLLKDEQGTVTGILASGLDITEREQVLAALRESERSKSVLLSHIPGVAYRCVYDRDWTMEFVSNGCLSLLGCQPEDLIDNNKYSFNDLICQEYLDKINCGWTHAVTTRSIFQDEYELTSVQGEKKWVMEIGQAVFDDQDEVEALEGIIIDITESKKAQAHILYMDVHDFMTGLYNRKKYEQEKRRLEDNGDEPVSLLMADINGIRLINNTFGHAEGDRMIIETAGIMRACCRNDDILVRAGGDEFILLMPHTGYHEACEVQHSIEQACETFNRKHSSAKQYISLSIGLSTKEKPEDNLEDTEKRAEDNLRKRKMFEHKSYHSATLSSIMATMYARSHETEEHAMRLAHLCVEMGKIWGLPQQSLDELQLFSMMHDIGKVGIDDSILNKPGKLTEEEWVLMKKHPEIGYSIALSTPETETVADYILSHHERWDGQGYPQGLSGEDIPLLSRILAVADAYDAMTENRIYRKAMTKGKAIIEIRDQAGRQFDPAVVKIFMEIVQDEKAGV